MIKLIKLNKNSWHFWFAWKLGNYDSQDPEEQNVCSYTRAVLKGIGALIIAICLLSSLAFLAVGLPLFAFGYLIGEALGYLPLPAEKSTVAGFFYPGCALLSVWILGGLGSGVLYLWRNRKIRVRKNDSFIKEAYKSWKGKYCTKVEFQ